MADQVGSDDGVAVGEPERHLLPVAGRVDHPVDEHHGRAAAGYPVDRPGDRAAPPARRRSRWPFGQPIAAVSGDAGRRPPMVCFWTNRGTFDPVEGDAALAGVFEPVRPATTFEETVERLGTAIRLGLLPPGSRLPSERDLATSSGSRARRCARRSPPWCRAGTWSRRAGARGGTFVAERPPLAEAEDKPLGDDAWAVLDYRVAVETGATILAAERGEPAQFERLDELVEQMAKATDFEEYRRADIRFHIGIAEAAGSPRLVRAMTEVQGQMSDLIALIPHPEQVLTHSNAQHKRPRDPASPRSGRRRASGSDARAHRGHRAHPRRAHLDADHAQCTGAAGSASTAAVHPARGPASERSGAQPPQAARPQLRARPGRARPVDESSLSVGAQQETAARGRRAVRSGAVDGARRDPAERRARTRIGTRAAGHASPLEVAG